MRVSYNNPSLRRDRNMNKHGIEFVMPDIMFEQAVHQKKETNQIRVKQIINNDYNEWLFIRQYVRENMWKLKGRDIVVEVSSLTDITDPYNCVMVNDVEMKPYLAIYEEIKAVEAAIERVERNKALDAGICPKCELPDIEIKPSMFHWRGNNFAGHVCKSCNSLWDYDDNFIKFTQAYSNLEKKGLVSGS
jgi:hypothetical protein